MKRSKMKWFAVVLCLGMAVGTFASRKDEVTLVLVPRDEASVKLGTDIAEKFPSLLVSYKAAPNGTVSLHGWTGSQWVNISSDDYRSGNFFRTGPDSAVVVEADGIAAPDSILPSPSWCQSAYRIATSETRPLLHLLGRHLEFSYKDWQWFAKRYNQDLDAINPDGLKISWYHKRLSDHLKMKEYSSINDLAYWIVIHEPVTEVEPTDVEEMDAVEDGAETVEDNPLSNAVHEAVVLGADAAIETAVVVEEPVAKEPAAEEKAAEEAASAEEGPAEAAPAEKTVTEAAE